MHKILCVQRYSPELELWKNLLRKKSPFLSSVADVVRDYKGFEGVEIFLEVFDRKKDYEVVESGFDFIHVLSGSDLNQTVQGENLDFLGFDYGLCEMDYTLFSSIFNEILFGCENSLVQFYKKLNRNFLFGDVVDVYSYINVHRELFDAGADIESPNEMKVYAVWGDTN